MFVNVMERVCVCMLGLLPTHGVHHVSQRLLCRASQQLGKAHLEADAEAGLHQLANSLVAHAGADGRQQQRAQHLENLHQHHLVAGQIRAYKLGVRHRIGNVLNARSSMGCGWVCRSGENEGFGLRKGVWGWRAEFTQRQPIRP